MRYMLKIKPAIPPEHRHKIQDLLEQLGYDVAGGGQAVDGSFSDVSFDGEEDEKKV